jgi:hypothetical protein
MADGHNDSKGNPKSCDWSLLQQQEEGTIQRRCEKLFDISSWESAAQSSFLII